MDEDGFVLSVLAQDEKNSSYGGARAQARARRALHRPSAARRPGPASRRGVPRWARELVRFALLMLATSFVTFALVSLSPIDPVQANVGQAAYASMSAERRAELAAYWGADTPLIARYVSWLASALTGDLGLSLRFNAPVVQVMAERAAGSLALMAAAWLLSGLIGLVLGIVAGACRDRLPDRLVRGYCYLISSTPTFWLGIVALMVFAVMLGWFPVGFSAPIGVAASQVTLADRAHHLVLPALVLSVTGVANIALHTREKVVDVLQSDYARFARTRGEGSWTVVRRHGLRNLVMPALTLQFGSISEIFGGSVLVEQVFSYPGLGQAAVTAGLGGDAPLLVGIALASAALVFAGNLAANLLYGVVDPRLRPRRRGGGGDAPHGSQAAQKCTKIEILGGVPAGEKRDEPVPGAVPAIIAPRSAENMAESVPASFSPAVNGTAEDVAACEKPDLEATAFGAVPNISKKVHSRPAALTQASAAPVLHVPARRTLGDNRRRTLVALLLAAAVLVAVVVAGGALAQAAQVTNFSQVNLAPSAQHLFGTDWMGRDMLARTLAGLATSVLVGLLAAAASSLIALGLAAVAALGGPRADAAVSWVVDLIMGIPHIVLLILISYALGRGAVGVTVGVALTHWPSLARVLRAEILQVRAQPYLQHARALGVSRGAVLRDHMLPYLLPQYLVGLVLMFPHAILHEASITFLGFGLPPEQPAIGVILSEAMGYLTAGEWWLAVFPGLALLLVVLLFDRVGAGLRRLLDARTVQE